MSAISFRVSKLIRNASLLIPKLWLNKHPAQPTADELMKLVDTFIQEKRYAKNSTLVRSHIKRLGEGPWVCLTN